MFLIQNYEMSSIAEERVVSKIVTDIKLSSIRGSGSVKKTYAREAL